jgi:transcriptional adapter 2-alpha
MLKCDYCCVRPSSLKITCLKCSSNRSIQICYKCSINVSQLREHSRIHPLSTYELVDIPLDENNLSEWLCNDEINLIEMIETCGLGNWSDISLKLSKNIFDCQNHFEDIYLSRSISPYSICFQSFPNTKQLIGENLINEQNFQLNSLIYPPMLIDSEQQKMLTYMPQRDEYEREYLNQAENRLPISNNDELFNDQQEQDGSRLLVHKAKLALLRSYKQILKRRFKLKDFIRDYAIGFNYSPDQEYSFYFIIFFLFEIIFHRMDLHQISRFLSADEYERLIYNHRR